MDRTNLFLIAFLLCSFSVSSQNEGVIYTPEDRQIFERFCDYIRPWQRIPTDSLLQKTALFFLDTPYVPHTLENEGKEELVINLRRFDCTTFVESVIALTRTVRSENPDFNTFIRELQLIRYRDGKREEYTSRLHYTSDWLHNNETKGIMKNISAGLNGVLEKKNISFMTSHREAYRQLKSDDLLFEKMKQVENKINQQGGFFYLPKMKISTVASKIPHMSIVAFTTTIEGLDVSHMGFAYRDNDRLIFIHASSSQKKVVIDKKTIIDYCDGLSSCNGIIVAEIL